MVTLSTTEREELERAVAAAEARTSAEIVLSVAEICDDYRLYTLPYAAVFGLLLFGGLALFVPDLHVRMAFLATSAAAFLAAVALQWRPLRLLAVPRLVREETAERLAQAEFAALVAGRTSAANGLLIFIALAERHAEIVADTGLAGRVPQETWRKIMDDLVAELAAGRVMTGLCAAVEACAAAAAAVFPAVPGDRDELSNMPRDARPR